ncbi:hypothetical protein HYH02_000474 [Chlamydomonas schloesseri]|nr:hypothetical protein HYH02_000474 [Chlamydomonas schloesseri]|eukprot:KAG2454634.1 hypothetical protein HYH02_000474 [Chlamydomonas schloesseri]
MLRALTYLHDHKILHRDIKPANILMDPDTCVAKLCDFGFARWTDCGPRDVQRCTSYVVTRWYRAPEVLVSDEYGPSSDVWSFGCLMAELATRRPLFQGTSTVDQLWRIMRCCGPLTPSQTQLMCSDPRLQTLVGLMPAAPIKPLRTRLPEVEPRLLELVATCLALDPAARPTARELLRLPYFWDLPRYIAGHAQLEAWYREDQGAAAAEAEAAAATTAAAAARLKAAPLPVAAPLPRVAQPPAVDATVTAPAAALPGAVKAAPAVLGGDRLSMHNQANKPPSQQQLQQQPQVSMMMALNQAAAAAARAAKAASLKQEAVAAVAAADVLAAAQLQQEPPAATSQSYAPPAAAAAPVDDPMDVAPVASGCGSGAVVSAEQQLSSSAECGNHQEQHAAKRAQAEASTAVPAELPAPAPAPLEVPAAAISPVTAMPKSFQQLQHVLDCEDDKAAGRGRRQQQPQPQQQGCADGATAAAAAAVSQAVAAGATCAAAASAGSGCAAPSAFSGPGGGDDHQQQQQQSSDGQFLVVDLMGSTGVQTATPTAPTDGVLTGLLVTPGASGSQQPIAMSPMTDSAGGLHGAAAAVTAAAAGAAAAPAGGSGQRIPRRNPSMVLLQTQNSMMLMANEFDSATTPVGAPPPRESQDGPLPHERPGVAALTTTSGAHPQAATVGGSRTRGVRRTVTCIALGNEAQQGMGVNAGAGAGAGAAAGARAAAGGRAHARAVAMDGAAAAAAHGVSRVAARLAAAGGAGVRGATVSGGIAPHAPQAPQLAIMRPARPPQPSLLQQSQPHAQTGPHTFMSLATVHTADAPIVLPPTLMHTRSIAVYPTADGAVAPPAHSHVPGGSMTSLPAGSDTFVGGGGGGRGDMGMLLQHLSYDASAYTPPVGAAGSVSSPMPQQQDVPVGSQPAALVASDRRRRCATQYGMVAVSSGQRAHASASDFDAAAGATSSGSHRSVEGQVQQQTAGGRLFDSSASPRGTHRSLPWRGPSRLSQIGLRLDSPSGAAAAAAGSGEGSTSPPMAVSMGMGLTPTNSGPYPAAAVAVTTPSNHSAWMALSGGVVGGSGGGGMTNGGLGAHGFPTTWPAPAALVPVTSSADLNNKPTALSAAELGAASSGAPLARRSSAGASQQACDGAALLPVALTSSGPAVSSPASRLRRRTVTGDVLLVLPLSGDPVDAALVQQGGDGGVQSGQATAGTPRAGAIRGHRSVEASFTTSALGPPGSPRAAVSATAAAAVAVAAAGSGGGISVITRSSATASGLGVLMAAGGGVGSPRVLPMVAVDSVQGSHVPSRSAQAGGGSQKSMAVAAPAAASGNTGLVVVGAGYAGNGAQPQAQQQRRPQELGGQQRSLSSSGNAASAHTDAPATAPTVPPHVTGASSSSSRSSGGGGAGSGTINKLVQAFKRVVSKF